MFMVRSTCKIWDHNHELKKKKKKKKKKKTHGGNQPKANYYVRQWMNIAHRITMVQVRQQVP